MMKYNLNTSRCHRIPRKLKKAISSRNPYWVLRRLESRYQHIFNYKLYDGSTKYSKCCSFWRMYDSVKEYNETPENLYNMFGYVTYDMVEEYNKVMSNSKKYIK